ncbi:hypothetical protein EGM88_09995 [Aureibaculum marinum]|uniref:Uncharacterized protein n=1 Tax=Aureibaculum marinum TaxID=2487930 RepID=A0A3N4NKD4_9FLAO|nr:hypothetical protein [Aureibaculum marinum]RPD96681.1 hypothetical protein EGM88_09995 [Aureibaculum marinum]
MKKIVISISGSLILIIAAYFFLRKSQLNDYKERGDIIVQKVKNYKFRNGNLPNSVIDINSDLEMGEGPYYEKLNDTVFIVYFNIGFDDMLLYNSSKNEWESKP